jgi:CBS domain-containing protein
MSKTVADVMTPNVRTIHRGASVVDAAKTMLDGDVGSVPVVDNDGNLCGIITDRDIALRVVAEGRDSQATRVEEIASADPHCAAPEESLDDAYERMTAWRIRRLPVVQDDRPVGMLSQADLVHELRDKKAGQFVDEISQPGEPAYAQHTVGID